MTAAALRLKNRKQRLWKRYIKTKDLYDRAIFTKTKNELRKLTRQLRTDFETKLAEESKQKSQTILKVCQFKAKNGD